MARKKRKSKRENRLKNKALVDAARAGNADGIRAALRAGADVNYNSGAPLWAAVTANRINIVRQLLQAGATPSLGGEDSPLSNAAGQGRTEMMQMLLDFGDDGHATLNDLLCRAAYGGRQETVSALIQRGADPFARGQAALNHAIAEGHDEVAAYLQEIQRAEKDSFLAEMAAATDLKLWLRQDYKATDEIPLVRAVKMRCFDAVVDAMDKARTGLYFEDMIQVWEHERAQDFLAVVINDYQLDKILDPRLWRGRLGEMQRVWREVPEEEREVYTDLMKFDFSSVVSAYHRMMLRDRKGPSGLKP